MIRRVLPMLCVATLTGVVRAPAPADADLPQQADATAATGDPLRAHEFYFTRGAYSGYGRGRFGSSYPCWRG